MRRLPSFEDRKDFLGGLLMLALGLATGVHASSYAIGSLRRMGAGLLPAQPRGDPRRGRGCC